MSIKDSNGKKPEFNPIEAMAAVSAASKHLTDIGLPHVIVYIDPQTATHTNPNGVQYHHNQKKDITICRMLALAVDRWGEVQSLNEGTSRAGIVLPSGAPAPEVRPEGG